MLTWPQFVSMMAKRYQGLKRAERAEKPPNRVSAKKSMEAAIRDRETAQHYKVIRAYRAKQEERASRGEMLGTPIEYAQDVLGIIGPRAWKRR
jgi:hypothetical protein